MELITLSIPIAFVLGIVIGYFIGVNRAFKLKILPEFEKKINEKLKVFHKAEPKTYDEKRAEAVDKGKKIIKTFYK